MKKFIFLFLFSSLFTMHTLGQTQEKEEIRKDTIIKLIKSIKDPKTVIMFDNEDFIIKSSLSKLIENLNNWLLKHPNLEADKEFLNLIMDTATSNEVINVANIAEQNKLTHRLRFRMAEMLENGECQILEKQEKKVISKIKVQTYSYYCGPLCGNGGRRFYFVDKLIFSVMDWIS